MSQRPGSEDRPLAVLLVEDDLDQAHLVRFLMEADGRYKVTLAQDGVRGSEFTKRGGWALVITDINLPGEDGLQVMATSKEAHPHIPVLATTAYTSPDYTDRAIRSGADDVLIKPLDKEELLTKVEILVRRGIRTKPAGGEEEETSGRAPVEDEEGKRPNQILVVAVRPGEIEAGCAGCLLLHRERGDRVAILTLGPGASGEEGHRRKEAAKGAARALGARLYVGPLQEADILEGGDVERLVQGAIREFRPSVVYLPSGADENPLHSALRELVLRAGEGIERIYAYAGSTTDPSFRPTVFVTVRDVLEAKLVAAAQYAEAMTPHLEAAFIRAQARYWGRYAAFTDVEPLEVVRGPPEWFDGPTGEG